RFRCRRSHHRLAKRSRRHRPRRWIATLRRHTPRVRPLHQRRRGQRLTPAHPRPHATRSRPVHCHPPPGQAAHPQPTSTALPHGRVRLQVGGKVPDPLARVNRALGQAPLVLVLTHRRRNHHPPRRRESHRTLQQPLHPHIGHLGRGPVHHLAAHRMPCITGC